MATSLAAGAGDPALFPLHKLAELLVPDPDRPLRLVLLTGFLGKSAMEDHRRLYHSMDMDWGLDIPLVRLFHVEQIGVTADDPYGRTAVWIKAGDDPALPPLTLGRTVEAVDLCDLQAVWNALGGSPGQYPHHPGGWSIILSRPTGAGILYPQPPPPPGPPG